jgi:hypothetical protein
VGDVSAVITDGELSTPPDPTGWLAEFGDLPQDETTQITLTIFDDMITTDSTVNVLSNPLLNGLMGAFDQVALLVTVSQVVHEPFVQVFVTAQAQHSADGRAWINKSSVPEIPSTRVDNDAGGATLSLGFVDGTIPSLAFFRFLFQVVVTGASGELWLNAVATCNNTREKAFIHKVDAAAYGGACTGGTIQGGTVLSVFDDGSFSDSRINTSVAYYGPPASTVGVTDLRANDAGMQVIDPDFWWGPYFEGAGSSGAAWLTLNGDLMICFQDNNAMSIVRGTEVIATNGAGRPVYVSVQSDT